MAIIRKKKSQSADNEDTESSLNSQNQLEFNESSGDKLDQKLMATEEINHPGRDLPSQGFQINALNLQAMSSIKS
ncbi:hypothetical protein ES703_88363 [subsurface metagenome]